MVIYFFFLVLPSCQVLSEYCRSFLHQKVLLTVPEMDPSKHSTVVEKTDIFQTRMRNPGDHQTDGLTLVKLGNGEISSKFSYHFPENRTSSTYFDRFTYGSLYTDEKVVFYRRLSGDDVTMVMEHDEKLDKNLDILNIINTVSTIQIKLLRDLDLQKYGGPIMKHCANLGQCNTGFIFDRYWNQCYKIT